MTLANKWHLYNLRESPYFQQDLQATDDARYPTELFVGREREAGRILATVGGSASSRQTVEGPPGFGKTTLVQFVKGRAVDEGYLSYPDPVSLVGADTAEALLVRILAYVYDAVASRTDEALLRDEAVDAARRLVLATRRRDVKVAAQVAGFGFDREVTERTEPAMFVSALLTIPHALRELARATRRHGYTGILVHLNNVENLVGDGRLERASGALRDLRDLYLLEGYHYLLVGPTEAMQALVGRHAQLRSVFGVSRPLPPLSSGEFQALLARRYLYLQLRAEEPFREPVGHDAAGSIYALFQGDVRGALRALEAGASELIGYTDPPGASIDARQLAGVLGPLMRAEADAVMSETQAGCFYALGEVDEEEFSQNDLKQAWRLSQATVSDRVKEFQRLGYVRERRRAGRQVWYGLTGSGRLALGRMESS
jgi:DNA-binding MarR family transcriptional regulator